MLAADVDHWKAFDSVNQDALWKIVDFRGVPEKLIDLISEFHSGSESAVRCGGVVVSSPTYF